MSKDSGEKITQISRVLRGNMTREEKHLWYDFLKKLPIPAYRQKPLGNCIVDFYIPCVKLVIELDGSQHGTPSGRERDLLRDDRLIRTGNLVLRYSNEDIRTAFEGVCLDIVKHIRERGMGDDWMPFPER